MAIELGSSKLTGIAGKKNSDGSIQVLAYAREEASSFIRKGSVYNIDKMAQSLTSIINKLESELDGASIAKVYVGIGGQSLRSKKNFIARQMDEETKIQKELIDSIMESNLHTSYADLEILDVVPQEYKVKNSYVTDPIGMMSNQIEGRYLNIVARSSVKQNLLTSFQQAKIDIAELLIAPMSTADILLTDAEKRSGCALVDFGADTTTVAIYKNDILRHLAVLPLGSNNIAKDICSLQLEESDAEVLKMKYGYAYTAPEEQGTGNKVYTLDERISVPAKKLNEIVEARTEEIIANVLNQIETSDYHNKLTAGIILTGGGSNLKRLTEAFTVRHNVNKVRIANFVQWEIKATKPELLIKNGTLNTLFGLLAAGKENCCEVETAKVPDTLLLFPEEEQTDADELKKIEQGRIRKEEEAKRLAQDDEFWETCQNNEEWHKYLNRYPEGRHAEEARKAIGIAEQKQIEAEDDAYWEACQSNKKPWKKYLDRYPEGRHTEEALKMQEEQSGESFFVKFGRKLNKFGEDILKEE